MLGKGRKIARYRVKTAGIGTEPVTLYVTECAPDGMRETLACLLRNVSEESIYNNDRNIEWNPRGRPAVSRMFI